MDQFLLEMLKQSPSVFGCVIAIILFLKAMRERDSVFLATLQQFHRENREDRATAESKTNILFERNIDALAKNSERLDANTDALNNVKDFIRTR
jgi:hypothetical protein